MFAEAIRSALGLILSGDGELYSIIGRSLSISIPAVLLAGLIGLPCGLGLGLKAFPGKNLLLKLVYVCMGLPPVFVGLLVFLFLSRSGPVAPYFYILFTPSAMIIAQVILATPIIIGLTISSVEGRAPIILQTAKGLGANKSQTILTLVKELKINLVTALVTAFGRVIAEVGAVTIVGGDIKGYTQVLTTAIVLETRMGNFSMAIALGLILLTLSYLINALLFNWQYRR